MPDPYQKCNRVATIIKLNEKIMLRDSIHAIIPSPNQSAVFVGVVVGFLNICIIRLVASA